MMCLLNKWVNSIVCRRKVRKMSEKRNKFNVDEELNAEFNADQLKKIGHYIKKYKTSIIITVAIIFISTIANLVTPLLLKYAIDDFIPNKNVEKLAIACIMFLAIIIISSISMKYRIRWMTSIGQNIIADIRKDLFVHIQKLPFTYFDSRPHGKILVRVVNYVNALSNLLSNGLINLIIDCFTFIVALIIMYSLHWKLSLVVTAFVPVAGILVLTIKTKQRKSMQEVSAKQSNMNAYIHESISGMKVTQSFTREEINFQIFNDIMDEYQEKWMTSRKYIALIWPIVKNISIISQGAMLLVALLVMRESVTVGLIVAFMGYTGNLWMPLLNISEFYNQLVAASAYLERIFETMEVEPEIQNANDAYDLPLITGNVSFKNVVFGYEEGQVILDNFNLQVKKGETIALVGPTGAGKTTVVNLISRFYDVISGQVLIDGHDVKDVKLDSLRKQMGIMMQDSFIFSGTIMDNIRYGKLDATDEDVIEAAKVVKAHDFIVEMEDGYYTEVNERGSRLSTGQRQLISFARALLADPKILILDEATSSIDTNTEKVLQSGLEKLLEGRTSFVVAHRLSTIKNADRILVIDNKGIEEIGNHNELMKNKGHYYDLYQAQIKFLKQA